MKKEFIPYEEALELKELGFEEPFFGWYQNNRLKIEKNPTNSSDQTYMRKEDCFAPMFSQAFRWFREKYNLNSFVIDSKSYNWYFNINNIIKDDVVSEVLYFKTHEEAELECLKKLIEIVKEKK